MAMMELNDYISTATVIEVTYLFFYFESELVIWLVCVVMSVYEVCEQRV